MKNTEIIMKNKIALMNSGVIGSTGNTIKITSENGEVITVPEPEEIHTPGGWKSLGYSVKPTENAIASFKIWRLKPGTNTMHKVPAFFFKKSQVEPMVAVVQRLQNSYYIGQKLYWHVHEFGTHEYIKAVVTELYEDHAIARTEGNTSGNQNDMNLWIDRDNEADFIDVQTIENPFEIEN